MAADTYVTFGADTGALEAGAAAVKARMSELSKEMRNAATEFSRMGAAANSELGQKLKGLGDEMALAKDKARALGDEIRKAGGGANDNFKNLSGDFKKLTHSIADNAYELGPWTGTHVEMAKLATLGLANACGVAALGFVALGAAVVAAVGLISASVISAGIETRKMAGEFDQAVSDIGGMGAIARRAGVEVRDLGKALHDMQANAKKDSDDDDFKKTAAALGAVGLKIDDIKGKAFPQVLQTLAGAFSQSADSANKYAAAIALLGDDVARKLLPELDRGAAHMRDMDQYARASGAAIGDDLSAKIAGTQVAMQSFGDAASKLGMALSGVGHTIYESFKPAIDGMIQTFADLTLRTADGIMALNNMGQSSLKASGEMSSIKQAAAEVAVGISDVVAIFQGLAVTAVEAIAQIGNALNGLSQAADAFGRDLKSTMAAAFGAFYEIAMSVINSVKAALAGVMDALAKASSMDFSGAAGSLKAGFADAATEAGKIGEALSKPIPGIEGTRTAVRKMLDGMTADHEKFAAARAQIEADADKRTAMIRAGGAAAPAKGTRKAGSSEVPDEDSGGGKKGGKGAGEGARAAQTEIDGEIQALRAGLEQKKAIYAEGVKLKLISAEQGAASTKRAVEEEYQAERALLQKMAALDGLKPAQKQQVNNKIEQLEQKHAQEMFRIAAQEAQAIVGPWHKMVDTMANSLSSSITGMITGTKKFSDAVRDMAKAIINEFVRMGIESVATWAKGQASKVALSLANETQITGAVAAGAAARTGIDAGAEAASIATRAAGVMKNIGASAAEAFAGVFGFMSPIMGPAAAGPAAAAEASVMAVAGGLYDVGAWQIDKDQPAYVHKREMIMTAAQSDGLRNVIELARGAASGQRGPTSVSAPVSLSVSAMDAQSVKRVFTGNGRALMKALSTHVRNGTALGMRGLSPV